MRLLQRRERGFTLIGGLGYSCHSQRAGSRSCSRIGPMARMVVRRKQKEVNQGEKPQLNTYYILCPHCRKPTPRDSTFCIHCKKRVR